MLAVTNANVTTPFFFEERSIMIKDMVYYLCKCKYNDY